MLRRTRSGSFPERPHSDAAPYPFSVIRDRRTGLFAGQPGRRQQASHRGLAEGVGACRGCASPYPLSRRSRVAHSFSAGCTKALCSRPCKRSLHARSCKSVRRGWWSLGLRAPPPWSALGECHASTPRRSSFRSQSCAAQTPVPRSISTRSSSCVKVPTAAVASAARRGADIAGAVGGAAAGWRRRPSARRHGPPPGARPPAVLLFLRRPRNEEGE